MHHLTRHDISLFHIVSGLCANPKYADADADTIVAHAMEIAEVLEDGIERRDEILAELKMEAMRMDAKRKTKTKAKK